MAVQDRARTIFGGMRTRFPAAKVAVKFRGDSADGLSLSRLNASGFTEYGEQGAEESGVVVDASELTEPHIGATILIDGEEKTVTAAGIDPAGALLRIDYHDQDPVEGV